MKNLLIAVALLAMSSCATMVNGRTQDIIVESYPSGAKLAVDCGNAPKETVTPVRLTVPRRAPRCMLTLSHEGYATREVALTQQRSRAMTANYVFGVPVAIFTGIAGLFVGDFFDDPGVGGAVGAATGAELGAAPARQIDKHTGGAYKWVPGRVFVTMVRSEEPLE